MLTYIQERLGIIIPYAITSRKLLLMYLNVLFFTLENVKGALCVM